MVDSFTAHPNIADSETDPLALDKLGPVPRKAGDGAHASAPLPALRGAVAGGD